jgi:class 3 adenylate cyclase
MRLVPDYILQRAPAGCGGVTEGAFDGAAVFVDISGFTALTEALSARGPRGAEAVADALRFYFDPLVAAAHAGGGWISRYAGDAFTALFEDPLAAVAAAARARDVFAASPRLSTVYGDFDFAVKVGVSEGRVEWGVVEVARGRGARFYVRGPAVDRAAALEHLAAGGQVVLSGGLAAFAPSAPLAAGPGAPPAALLLPGPLPGPAPAPPAPSDPDDPAQRRFWPPEVERAPSLGEFRYVASVFAAFEPAGDPAPLTRDLERLARRFGGTFNGLDFGDKGCNALVFFGAPSAHEDDIERALDFANALRAARRGLRRGLRVGVAWGPVYAGFYGGDGRQEYSCLGRAVNLAARLMVAAAPGQICCGPEVTGRAGPRWRLSPLGERALKGFALPLPVHALEGRVSVPPPAPRLAPVGRRPQLNALTRAAAAARASGRGAVIWMDGEAGSGKSALAEHWRTGRAGAAWRWLGAPCDPVLREPFNPFIRALQRRFQRACPAGAPGARAALDQGVERLAAALSPGSREADELARRRAALADLLGLGRPGEAPQRPEARRDRILHALAAWVGAELALGPVVLHLEDAQWADPDSADALRRVSALARDRPLLLLISGRLDDAGGPARLPLHDGLPQRVIALPPLALEDIAALVAMRLDREDPELAEAIWRRSGGNPFFAEQLLGAVGRGRAAGALPGALPGALHGALHGALPAALPDDLHAALIARLDALPPSVRRAVSAAAVLGMEFDVPVLAGMLAPGDAGAAEGGEAGGLWRPIAPHRYRFRNTLLRDAAYRMLSTAALRSLHGRAADALLAAYGRALAPHHAALGLHLERAGLPQRARPHYLRAARAAAGRGCAAEARRLAGRVLALGGGDTLEREARALTEPPAEVAAEGAQSPKANLA